MIPMLAAAQDPVFKSTTRLVELSVVATDDKGNPVTDLKKEDFTVLEDGKSQQISHFFTEAMLRNAPPPPALPKGIFTNRPEFLPSTPKTVNAIVIDYLNTPWAAQTATREQLLAVLRTLGENDVVAIYTLGQTLTILHDFTSDRKALEEKLKHFEGILTLRGRSQTDLIRQSADRWSRVFLERRAEAENVYQATMQRTRTLLTIRSLSLLARHMAGIPGRKNLIWMSAGFPISVTPTNTTTPTVLMSESAGFRVQNMPRAEVALSGDSATLFLDTMDKAIEVMNDAGVAVYGLDVMGLVIPMALAEEGFNSAVTNSALVRFARDQVSQTSLVELSSRTGGVATLNSNDISAPMKRALDDARYAYTLAYYTTNPKNDGKFRKLEIKLKRPGVKLRYRNGYTADDQGRSQAPSLKADLDEAAKSPIIQTAVLLTAQLQPKSKDEFNLALQIEPTQISFQQKKDAWEASLDLMFFQKTPDGKMNGLHAALPLKLSLDAYQTVLKKGLLYRRTITRDAGAFALRVVVRDATNGATGTLDIPLETP
ncbi:MAG: VWA domain-containing protein [Candidatus Solibacter usitatus]|nr:VWA domain-containing protein [Candidatus Solibacter usitatus]